MTVTVKIVRGFSGVGGISEGVWGVRSEVVKGKLYCDPWVLENCNGEIAGSQRVKHQI